MKMKKLYVALLFFLTQCTPASISVIDLKQKDIPAAIKYKGDVENVAKFTDKEGDHFVITTTDEGVKKVDGEDDYRTASLYAYCYNINGGQYNPAWHLYDFADDCQEDIEAVYKPNSFAITDLDHNGVAEVWLMYITACKGDVSPSDMKIIMHEGNKKYAVRGTTRVRVNATDYIGGEYSFDAAFKVAPDSFRKYAENLWKKNVNETHFY